MAKSTAFFFLLLYRLVLLLVFSGLFPVLLYRRWRHGKYRESLPGMLGRRLGEVDRTKFSNGSLWLHAVSVGEVVAARAVADRLRAIYPHLPLVVSTTTETGQTHARRLFNNSDATITFYPLDWPGIVARFHDTFQPRVVILLEAEIWPAFLIECQRRDVHVAMVNGRLSDRSYRRHRMASVVMRGILSKIDLFCMQTPDDAARMQRLIGRSEHIHAIGNVKFDHLPGPLTQEDRQTLSLELGLPPESKAILFGSTHASEEEIALEAWQAWRRAGFTHTLMICPRHPERFEAVARMLGEARLPDGTAPRVLRASAIKPSSTPQPASAPEIILLDRMGVLARAFGLSQLAFLGGSYLPNVGGHNLLEPASHGIPVLCGPYMHSQKEIVRLMGASGAYHPVSRHELPARIVELLGNHVLAADLGQRGRLAAEANRGASERFASLLAQSIPLPTQHPGGHS